MAYLEVGRNEWCDSPWPQGNKISILIKKIWLSVLNRFQIIEQIELNSNNDWIVVFVLGTATVIIRPEGQKPSYITDCDDPPLS